jgi:hypothetical protein
MLRFIPPRLFAGALAGSIWGLPSAALAGDYSNPKVIDGIEIHLGIVPADMALKDPVVYKHGNKGHGSHHLLVALTDPSNGARVGAAEVRARVAEVGLNGQEKQLDPLTMSPSKVSFGNFFLMNGLGPFRITLTIRRDSASTPIEANFEYP